YLDPGHRGILASPFPCGGRSSAVSQTRLVKRLARRSCEPEAQAESHAEGHDSDEYVHRTGHRPSKKCDQQETECDGQTLSGRYCFFVVPHLPLIGGVPGTLESYADDEPPTRTGKPCR